MDHDFKAFLESQIAEIKRYKWIESEKSGYDLGDMAVKDWIEKHSRRFRQTWYQNNKDKKT